MSFRYKLIINTNYSWCTFHVANIFRRLLHGWTSSFFCRWKTSGFHRWGPRKRKAVVPWSYIEVVEFDESLQDGATLLLYRQEFNNKQKSHWVVIYFFSPLFGEDEPILTIIFFSKGWFNHQLDHHWFAMNVPYGLFFFINLTLKTCLKWYFFLRLQDTWEAGCIWHYRNLIQIINELYVDVIFLQGMECLLSLLAHKHLATWR